MPQSTHRHRHKHAAHIPPPQHQIEVKHRPKRSAALLMAIFIGVLGLVIGYFASSVNYLWMVASTAIGVVAGALIGHGIDRTIQKKD